jgi:hypothetical protein
MADDRNDNPLEQLVELLVYAPVGLLYEYNEVLPKLVRRGKSQVALARFFGQAAVRKGSDSAEEALGEAVSTGAQLLARAVTELGAAIGLAPDQPAARRPAPAPAPAPAPPGASASPPPAAPPSAGDTGTDGDPAPDAGTDGEVAGESVDVSGHGTDLAAEVAAPGESAAEVAAQPEPDESPVDGAGGLPIAGYDDLTARVVVSLLDELSPAQRARIRFHEEANRARKTVLAKLDRLDRA